MKALLTTLFVVLLLQSISFAEPKKTRDQQVIEDREELKDSDAWIYNDFEAAREAATAAKKPIMIVFRCIP